jgi:hypothetical protein
LSFDVGKHLAVPAAGATVPGAHREQPVEFASPAVDLPAPHTAHDAAPTPVPVNRPASHPVQLPWAADA